MAVKNPYYIYKEDTQKLTAEQIKSAKFNNYFLMSVFTRLVQSNGENAVEAVSKSYLPGLLLNSLPKTDIQTGIDSKNLGAKVKFLIQALQDSKANRESFNSSFFADLIHRLAFGSIRQDYSKRWKNYKATKNCIEKYKEKDPFDAAILCHSKNDNLPVGINFATLIDGIVVANNRGEFHLRTNFNPLSTEAVQMTDACDIYLTMLQENPTFVQNFYLSEDESFASL
ncbi:MAG: hypothetical protein IJX25_01870 [Clostridia bacterium]|nr:hypothetical protein [Clostridia bacterium]MBQ8792948.1 hypothetical protein [Clostridia bacterium]